MDVAREHIPQVLAIVSLPKTGRLSLKQAVRAHLGSDDEPLYLAMPDTPGHEVRLTSQPVGAAATFARNRLELPAQVSEALDLQPGDLLAMVERPAAVALKKLMIVERPGRRARVFDIETDRSITRVAETNPPPEKELSGLAEQVAQLVLRADVRAYLRDRDTLPAWQARQLLKMAHRDDDRLRGRLTEERLASQQEDGSWDDEVVATSRNLRELAELGLSGEHAAVARGVAWLLARSESQANPGMFFLSDDLVAEQARVLEQRQAGGRDRFRERRRSEMRRVEVGDELIVEPCGPRIMWPNALALEALLALDYESHPRVRRALATLLTREWCECGYQHGVGLEAGHQPMTDEELAALDARCMAEYRYGGLLELDELRAMDASKRVGNTMPREGHAIENGLDVYPLRMPTQIQDCEAITTRTLALAHDSRVRRAAEAHLWRFVGRQHGADGRFEAEQYRFVSPWFFLELFARFEHPAAQVGLLRSVPWIIAEQNADGSWGGEDDRDAATLAVIRALLAVGRRLPAALRP